MLEKPIGGRGAAARRRAGRRGREGDGHRRRRRRPERGRGRDRHGRGDLRLRPHHRPAPRPRVHPQRPLLDVLRLDARGRGSACPRSTWSSARCSSTARRRRTSSPASSSALMKRSAVLVDVSIDQGGCFETSRPTTHSDPTYEVDGVTHYCVANMPGAVPITCTYALTNATMPYVVKLADHGRADALGERSRLHGRPQRRRGPRHLRARRAATRASSTRRRRTRSRSSVPPRSARSGRDVLVEVEDVARVPDPLEGHEALVDLR